MTVNITNISGIDSVYDMGLYASNGTGGLFWGLILISLLIVIIVRLRHLGAGTACTAASFACLFISLILLNIGFVDLLYCIFFGVGLAGSLMFMAIGTGGGGTPF